MVHQPDVPQVPNPSGEIETGPSPTLRPAVASSNEEPQPTSAEPDINAVEAIAKIIKRYSNRKLYDTARSKYVTLDEIARMVRAGEDVRHHRQ